MIEIVIAKFSDRLDHIQRIHEQMRAGGPVIDQEATLPDLNVIGMGLPSHIVAGKGKQSTAIMQTTKGGRRAAPRCLLPRGLSCFELRSPVCMRRVCSLSCMDVHKQLATAQAGGTLKRIYTHPEQVRTRC
jgi:hypothetical protein